MSPGDHALCVAHVESEIESVVGVNGDTFGNNHDVRHRVVKKNAMHVVTKGDKRESSDESARLEDIHCTVVYSKSAGWWPRLTF